MVLLFGREENDLKRVYYDLNKIVGLKQSMWDEVLPKIFHCK